MFQNGETACFDCAFAEWNEKTQTGCAVNRIKKFEDAGINVLEVYNNDLGLEFYVIEDRICSYYRTRGWKNKQVGKDLENVARSEILSRMIDIIVFAQADSDIVPILNQIDGQTMRPANVHLALIDPQISQKPVKYLEILKKYNFPWQFHHIVNPNTTEFKFINYIGDKCKSYYYSVFYHDFSLPTNFVEKIYNRTYEEMKEFSLMQPIDFLSGLVVQADCHRSVGGNSTKTTEEKLVERAQEQELPHMIIKYKDLFHG